MKIKCFYILFFLLLLGNTELYAQNKSKSADIELIANDMDNTTIPEKLQIEYSFLATTNDTKYKVKFTVKAITKDLSITQKEYEYTVRSNNVEKDFKKEAVVNNIIFYFYLDEKNYSNAKDIRKRINRTFESVIEAVKFDVDRTKSNKEIEVIQEKKGN